jgi:hypothetical protein
MKTRFILVLLCLASVSLLAVSCSDDPYYYSPELRPATETPEPTASPTSNLFDYTQVSCEGKPLYAWAQSGTRTFSNMDQGSHTITLLDQRTEPFFPDTSLNCGPWVGGFGQSLSELPVSGIRGEWSDICVDEGNSTLTQHRTTVVIGWEEITTQLGTFRALRTDSTNTYAYSGSSDAVISASDWYVCGYGIVYSTISDSGNLNINGPFELLSYTPLTTDESRVRYILADIQLGGVDGYYREHVDAEEVAEALRRWDAGITVTNIHQFERKIVNENWQVVYAGTETLIDGSDVLLTTDPQP